MRGFEVYGAFALGFRNIGAAVLTLHDTGRHLAVEV